jgi:hypothetical protein
VHRMSLRVFRLSGPGVHCVDNKQDGVWHFRVNGPDKVAYWRKGFELVLAIAASRVRAFVSARVHCWCALCAQSAQSHTLFNDGSVRDAVAAMPDSDPTTVF